MQATPSWLTVVFYLSFLSQILQSKLIPDLWLPTSTHTKLFHIPPSIWNSSQVVLVVKNLPANAGDVRDMGLIPGLERSLGGMAIHSSILARRIPWTEEPGRLQSMGSQSRTQLKWLSTHEMPLTPSYSFAECLGILRVLVQMLPSLGGLFWLSGLGEKLSCGSPRHPWLTKHSIYHLSMEMTSLQLFSTTQHGAHGQDHVSLRAARPAPAAGSASDIRLLHSWRI